MPRSHIHDYGHDSPRFTTIHLFVDSREDQTVVTESWMILGVRGGSGKVGKGPRMSQTVWNFRGSATIILICTTFVGLSAAIGGHSWLFVGSSWAPGTMQLRCQYVGTTTNHVCPTHLRTHYDSTAIHPRSPHDPTGSRYGPPRFPQDPATIPHDSPGSRYDPHDSPGSRYDPHDSPGSRYDPHDSPGSRYDPPRLPTIPLRSPTSPHDPATITHDSHDPATITHDSYDPYECVTNVSRMRHACVWLFPAR